jgi:hypothetical protein
MKISVRDASEYFRGLLLLIKKDHKITETENGMMKRIGQALGFEREFCADAIRDLLENKYILDAPPEFSTRDLAMKFVKDGLTLAFSDQDVPASEVEWLRNTAERNGLDMNWFLQEWKGATNRKQIDIRLEVDDLCVMYSRRGQ